MTQVLSINWGFLREIIEERVVEITKNKEPLPMKDYSKLIDLMDKILPVELGEKNAMRLDFVKTKIWKIKKPIEDYTWLSKKTSRIRKYTQTKLKIKESIEIDAIKNLCDGNLRVYGDRQFDKVKDVFNIGTRGKQLLALIEKLVRGSRSRGSNKYDKLHLLSCFFFTEDNMRDDLVFSTTDVPIIQNSESITSLPFRIQDLKSLNQYLDTL